MTQKNPSFGKNVFIAEGAVVRGDVTISDRSSVWYNAVVRTETGSIVIGCDSNIQDNCVLHIDLGDRMEIGNRVTIGHGAIVHGCAIGDNSLIGMGAIILNNAIVGKNCIVGAGALVTQGTIIPDNSLVLGSPAKVVRLLTDEEIKHNIENALMYAEEAVEYTSA